MSEQQLPHLAELIKRAETIAFTASSKIARGITKEDDVNTLLVQKAWAELRRDTLYEAWLAATGVQWGEEAGDVYATVRNVETVDVLGKAEDAA